MTTVRFKLGSFENEQAVIYMEYDDQTMRVSAIVCENGLSNSIYGALIRNTDHRVYSQIFPPGTTQLDIPTQGPTRIDIENLGRGHWGNLTIQLGYPA